jgi:hypothetical protein
VQQFETLCIKLGCERRVGPRYVPARMAQTGDQADLYRITDRREDNRYGGRGRFCSESRCRATSRDYHGDLTPYEIVCKISEAFVFVFGPSIFDLNRLPLDKAVIA